MNKYAAGKKLKPGDVTASNHPMEEGSHLPDITVITPIFYQDKIIFWVAARGHHADIGGISPGSMPPNSRILKKKGPVSLHLGWCKTSDFRLSFCI